MALSKNKTRTMVSLDKCFLEELKEQAEIECRSLNSLMIFALKEYMKKVNKTKKESNGN